MYYVKKTIEISASHQLRLDYESKCENLHSHDYFSINKYSKITFAVNEVTDKIFEDGNFKRFPFLKDHVEVCNETGKLILPISVDETVTQLPPASSSFSRRWMCSPFI